MLAIDIREDKKKAADFAKKLGMPFPVLLDTSGSVATAYGIRGIPAHFIIDQKGKILGAATGPRGWDSDESLKLFRYLIDHGSGQTPGQDSEQDTNSGHTPKTK